MLIFSASFLFTFTPKNNHIMRLFLKHLLFLLCFQGIFAQEQEEVNPPSNIKSIVFRGPTEDQFPVIKLGESIFLEFDDLLANEQDYYYKIVHCDYDWTPSKLLKSQFLKGIDNQRIINYENSYSTLETYSNYQLTIPNNNVSLKVSGNYVLEIYNNRYELQFSRRFIVFKDIVKVGATVKRSRDFEFLNEKQVVQFSINSGNFRLVNPKKEVKVAILQNYHWPTVITNIAPQFTLGNELVYKYDQETSFFGGNEYLLFDKNIRTNAVGGNFHFTENNYLILVYYRNFGDMYDSIIGVGSTNSRTISN